MSQTGDRPKLHEHELALKFVNGSDGHFVLGDLVSFLARRESLPAVALLTALLSTVPFDPSSSGLPSVVRPIVALTDITLFVVIFLGLLVTGDCPASTPMGQFGVISSQKVCGSS